MGERSTNMYGSARNREADEVRGEAATTYGGKTGGAALANGGLPLCSLQAEPRRPPVRAAEPAGAELYAPGVPGYYHHHLAQSLALDASEDRLPGRAACVSA